MSPLARPGVERRILHFAELPWRRTIRLNLLSSAERWARRARWRNWVAFGVAVIFACLGLLMAITYWIHAGVIFGVAMGLIGFFGAGVLGASAGQRLALDSRRLLIRRGVIHHIVDLDLIEEVIVQPRGAWTTPTAILTSGDSLRLTPLEEMGDSRSRAAELDALLRARRLEIGSTE